MEWICRERRLSYGTRVLVMGILNVTPDSFSDGGQYLEAGKAVAHAYEMAQAGADIIDVGGQSTRPGYQLVSWQEEWDRLRPVLRALCGKLPCALSVDTFYPQVAQRALDAGVSIVNDVSGSVSAEMAAAVASNEAGWILIHNAAVAGWAPQAVRTGLLQMAAQALSFGVSAASLCLDPGIGFGKNAAQNHALIGNVSQLKILGYPLLLGASRKRCVGEPAGDPPADKRDSGTIAAHTIGIWNGADIIRTHNVPAGVQAARVAQAIKEASNG